MRVLGVDPGSAITGWGVLDGPRASPRLVETGVIRPGGRGVDFPERLHRLATRLDELVRRLVPTAAAVEAPFHGVNARSALQLAHARGEHSHAHTAAPAAGSPVCSSTTRPLTPGPLYNIT